MPSFISLDVETANADVSSICQIGLVEFEGGEVKSRWHTLANPDSFFDPVNVSIHGINQQAVLFAPALNLTLSELLVARGAEIRILCESDFLRLVE